MCYNRRLLILSCSQRKRSSLEVLPAIERYNGPLFQVLRRFLREAPQLAHGLDIFILSAAYGLIPSDFPTPLYDRKMNPARAVELQPQVAKQFSDLMQNNYAPILLVLGKTYLLAFEPSQDLMSVQMNLCLAAGPIGKKQAQLKKWLWTFD